MALKPQFIQDKEALFDFLSTIDYNALSKNITNAKNAAQIKENHSELNELDTKLSELQENNTVSIPYMDNKINNCLTKLDLIKKEFNCEAREYQDNQASFFNQMYKSVKRKSPDLQQKIKNMRAVSQEVAQLEEITGEQHKQIKKYADYDSELSKLDNLVTKALDKYLNKEFDQEILSEEIGDIQKRYVTVNKNHGRKWFFQHPSYSYQNSQIQELQDELTYFANIKSSRKQILQDGELLLSPIKYTNNAIVDAETIKNRLEKINSVKNTLKQHINQKYIINSLDNLNCFAKSLKIKQNKVLEFVQKCDELKENIDLMKKATKDGNKSLIERYANLPIEDQVSNKYLSTTTKEYNSLIWHMRSCLFQTNEKPEVIVQQSKVKENSPFNLFAYVDNKIRIPEEKELRELRDVLLDGTAKERLTNLEYSLCVLANKDDVPDKVWISELKNAYKRDCKEGYLSHTAELDLKQDKLYAIEKLFDKVLVA